MLDQGPGMGPSICLSHQSPVIPGSSQDWESKEQPSHRGQCTKVGEGVRRRDSRAQGDPSVPAEWWRTSWQDGRGEERTACAMPPCWPPGWDEKGKSPGCFWELICPWRGVWPEPAVWGSARREAGRAWAAGAPGAMWPYRAEELPVWGGWPHRGSQTLRTGT